MNERLSRAIGVWVVVFIFLLITIPEIVLVGSLLVDHPVIILITAVLATLLGALELIS